MGARLLPHACPEPIRPPSRSSTVSRPAGTRRPVIAYETQGRRARLYQGDSRDLRRFRDRERGRHPDVAALLGQRIRGAPPPTATRGAWPWASGASARRVLIPTATCGSSSGDPPRQAREWVGFDALVTARLRRSGWRLQSKGIWRRPGRASAWDNRINYLLRFRKAGSRVRPTGATLCWMLPLPRTHPESIWDATPEPVLRAVLLASRKRGAVLDPFCGAGTVGRVALGRGPRVDRRRARPAWRRLTARRLKMVRRR